MPAGPQGREPDSHGGTVRWLHFQLSATSPRPTRRRTSRSAASGLNKALNRLSSGFRINTSGDDAAGLAIANNYRSEQAILTQGIRNANDGLSTLNIKDGALNNVSLLLDRLATLASQASSSAGGVDISKLEDEYNEVIDEIDREITVGGLDHGGGLLGVRQLGSDGGRRHHLRHHRRGRHAARWA